MELLAAESSAAISDREKFCVITRPKTWISDRSQNQPLKEGSGAYRVIHENRASLKTVIDKKVRGFPYKVMVGAIYNNHDEIIGSVVLSQSLAQQDELKQMADGLLKNISTLAATAEEITAQSEEITVITRTLAQVAKAAQTPSDGNQ